MSFVVADMAGERVQVCPCLHFRLGLTAFDSVPSIMVSRVISHPSLDLTYVDILAQPTLSAFSGIVVVRPA